MNILNWKRITKQVIKLYLEFQIQTNNLWSKEEFCFQLLSGVSKTNKHSQNRFFKTLILTYRLIPTSD